MRTFRWPNGVPLRLLPGAFLLTIFVVLGACNPAYFARNGRGHRTSGAGEGAGTEADSDDPLTLMGRALDALLAGEKAKVEALALDVEEDAPKIAMAMHLWAIAGDDSQPQLDALNDVILQAKQTPGADSRLERLQALAQALAQRVAANEATRPPVVAAEPAHDPLIAAQQLNCPELVAGLAARATETAGRLDVPTCEAQVAAIRHDVAAHKYADAFVKWSTLAAANGLVPALDAKSLKKKSLVLGDELKATDLETAGPQGFSRFPPLGRPQLLQSPFVLAWVPTLADRVAAQTAKLLERAQKAKSWQGLDAVLPALTWISLVLAQQPPLPDMLVWKGLLADARKGKYLERRTDWAALEHGAQPTAQALARLARGIAAAELVQKATARRNAHDWVGAVVALHDAAELDPANATLVTQQQSLTQAVAAERQKLLMTLQKGAKPAAVAPQVKRLDALDRATVGPGVKLPEATRAKLLAALDAFAADKPAAVWTTVADLDGGGVDYANAAIALLKTWAYAFGMKRLTAERAAQQFEEAERTINDVLMLGPDDPAAMQALDEIAELAHQERAERVERLFSAGLNAAGYEVVKLDARLTPRDRELLLAQHASQIADLRDRAVITATLKPMDHFAELIVANGAVASGPGWELTAVENAGAKRFWPITVRLRTLRLNTPPAKLVRTETAKSRYLAGRENVENPDKPACEQALAEKLATIERMKNLQLQSDAEVARCRRAAPNDRAAACGGDDTAAAIAADEAEVAAMRERCEAMPARVAREKYAEQAYTVEFWRADADALVEVSIEDAARENRVLAATNLKKTLQLEDRVARAQPQYNIVGDSNDLPTAAEMETELISDLPRQVTVFAAETLAAIPARFEVDIAAAQGPQQCEMIGRALLFEEASGENLADHAHWEDIVRRGCGTLGANPVAPQPLLDKPAPTKAVPPPGTP